MFRYRPYANSLLFRNEQEFSLLDMTDILCMLNMNSLLIMHSDKTAKKQSVHLKTLLILFEVKMNVFDVHPTKSNIVSDHGCKEKSGK